MRSIVIISSMNSGTREFGTIWKVDSAHRSIKAGGDIVEIDCEENRKIFVLDGVAYFGYSVKKKKDLIQLLAIEIRNHCIEAGNWDRVLLFHAEKDEMARLINIIPGIQQFQKSRIYHSTEDPGFYRDYIIPFRDAKCSEGELFDKLWDNIISEGEYLKIHDKETEIKQMQSNIINSLSSLDILLQGYLIFRNPEAILGTNYIEFMQEHGILQDGSAQKKDAMKKTSFDSFPDDQRLFRPSIVQGYSCSMEPSCPKDLGWFWFDECLPDIEETAWKVLAERYERLREKSKLKELWNLLRRGCLDKPDGISIEENCQGWTQDNFTYLFENAHREYISLF